MYPFFGADGHCLNLVRRVTRLVSFFLWTLYCFDYEEVACAVFAAQADMAFGAGVDGLDVGIMQVEDTRWWDFVIHIEVVRSLDQCEILGWNEIANARIDYKMLRIGLGMVRLGNKVQGIRMTARIEEHSWKDRDDRPSSIQIGTSKELFEAEKRHKSPLEKGKSKWFYEIKNNVKVFERKSYDANCEVMVILKETVM